MSATESSEYRQSRQCIAPFCCWYLHLGRLPHNKHFKSFAYYQDQKFGLVTLIDRRTAFHQHPKNTAFFQNAVVEGWKTMGFEEPVLPKD
ncbi:unnamed protein product [Prunus armeniaca]|uniref:Uncharacterized protein n=1 Tax=Prunus armeniaca TaxID=36596 RepID=A0A6J5W421_PRUAR|nr:unnamed protein product [Prunus armeniaca]